MVSFLVETFIAQGDRDRFTVAVDGLRAALEAMNELEHHVEHVRSYLVPSDEMGVHVVEANSVEVGPLRNCRCRIPNAGEAD